MKTTKRLLLLCAALLPLCSCSLLGSKYIPKDENLSEIETVVRLASPRHGLTYNTRGYLDQGYFITGEKSAEGGYIERYLQTPDLSREIILSAHPRTNVWSVTWTVNAARPQQTLADFLQTMTDAYGPCSQNGESYYWKIPYGDRVLRTTLQITEKGKVQLKMTVN